MPASASAFSGSAARTRANIASASAYFSSLTRAAPLLRSRLSSSAWAAGSTAALLLQAGAARMRASETASDVRSKEHLPKRSYHGAGGNCYAWRRPAPTC